MKIFLSYASEDRARAEEIQLALAGAGHEVFFDRQSLPAGGDYHERIRASVDEADLFVFLVSPDSVAEGGYALTEMGYARARWAHPKGRVLPVRLRPTPFPDIPAYLKSVTVLEPSGNTAAEVVAAVRKLAGGAGLSSAAKLGFGAAALAVGVAAVLFLRPHPVDSPAVAQPSFTVPDPLQLRFSYTPAAGGSVSLDDTLRVNLETKRRIVDGERLAQQRSGFYSYNTAYPTPDDKVLGTLVREVRASSLDAAPAPARFCLKRPTPVQPSDEQYVHLDCAESGSCALHSPSPKWLETCAVEPVKTSRGFSLIAEALAAEEAPKRWSVPSARTLATHKDQLKGVGYTVVDLSTDAFRDPSVIGVEVEVRVNGVPILEDGLLPALRPVPNDPTKPFVHSFALESLNFEGALAGCEKIELTLRPRLADGKGLGPPLAATLAYVALRDKARATVPLGKSTVTWEARYVIPADEWSHEVFITSVAFAVSGGDAAAAAARERSVALKQAFDRLGVRYDGRPVVAVIRPPLTQTGDRLAYGLTAGVVQPTGQVRFTFSPREAGRLGDALLAARAASPAGQRVIDRDKYLYRPNGTPERRSTPMPPGTCRHVTAG